VKICRNFWVRNFRGQKLDLPGLFWEFWALRWLHNYKVLWLDRTFCAEHLEWSHVKNGVSMQKLWPIEVCCRKLSKTNKTVQFGLNSDWTSRNGSNRLGCGFDFFFSIFFLLFFFLLPGDRNLTHGLWKRNGWNWKGRTKPNVKAVVEVYGGAVVQACGGVTMVNRTRNSNRTDTKTSNSTRGCRHKFNDANWNDNAKAQMV
jgi:hypothetical protein